MVNIVLVVAECFTVGNSGSHGEDYKAAPTSMARRPHLLWFGEAAVH